MRVKLGTVLHWLLYAAAILLILFLCDFFFVYIPFGKTTPLLLPIFICSVAVLESNESSVLFSLLFGFCWDLACPSSVPFLYTLGLTLSAMLSATLSQKLLSPGYFCTLISSVFSFILLDAILALSFILHGQVYPHVMLDTFLWEMLYSLPFLFLIFPVIRRIYLGMSS